MGMFDFYMPAGPLTCPVDGTLLINWQGGEGPRLLLTWREGQRYPTDEWPEEERIQPAEALKEFVLPEAFRIYCSVCPSHPSLHALCTTVGGVWTKTRLIPPPGYEDWLVYDDELGPPAIQTTFSRHPREFVLVDLTSQMPYIPDEARDWSRERLLSWLRVWGEVEPSVAPSATPSESRYRFRSWLGLFSVFVLTDDGRMFIPLTSIAAWGERPA